MRGFSITNIKIAVFFFLLIPRVLTRSTHEVQGRK